ncbi:MAG: hypothetical protein EOS73_24685 [Mesorhizobium sp.]|uniref:hypothetical protein n=1 Tax=Mesorhizobium sp. M7A.F.Ca.ET.027.02.1.1 TaxID=2496655 RepID=UPI000FD373D0|nr:hypothetical protein [Mesorhizobium sp. M7A.F.Ca.ET.027.02.1.1]RVD14625.1 hypothetical protein EN749_19035 [Mesorhizobium sp. M7A.F.Ca.ET.027.02.1.1]RWD00982.1 MAG: hypothetical protein EOS73_24685 [Mesorhizobium sp.]
MQTAERVEYSNLEADVIAWMKGHVAQVKEDFGEGEAYAEAVRLLDDDPWQALQWYVEDVRRGLKTAGV